MRSCHYPNLWARELFPKALQACVVFLHCLRCEDPRPANSSSKLQFAIFSNGELQRCGFHDCSHDDQPEKSASLIAAEKDGDLNEVELCAATRRPGRCFYTQHIVNGEVSEH